MRSRTKFRFMFRKNPFSSLVQSRLENIRSACGTVPSARVWRKCALLYCGFFALAFPVGMASGFLRFQPLDATWAQVAFLLSALLIAPSFLEELFFRVMLLPGTREEMPSFRRRALILISLLLFVLWHPLNGLAFRPHVWQIFSHPVFLVLVALFGATATAAYLVSGSIWPSVLMHWVTISGWVMFLGGRTAVLDTLGI